MAAQKKGKAAQQAIVQAHKQAGAPKNGMPAVANKPAEHGPLLLKKTNLLAFNQNDIRYRLFSECEKMKVHHNEVNWDSCEYERRQGRAGSVSLFHHYQQRPSIAIGPFTLLCWSYHLPSCHDYMLQGYEITPKFDEINWCDNDSDECSEHFYYLLQRACVELTYISQTLLMIDILQCPYQAIHHRHLLCYYHAIQDRRASLKLHALSAFGSPQFCASASGTQQLVKKLEALSSGVIRAIRELVARREDHANPTQCQAC